MALYLYLFQEPDNLHPGYFPSHAWTPHTPGRIFAHAELRIGYDTVITRDGIDTTYVADWADTPKEIRVVRIKLPHTEQQIKELLIRRGQLRLAGHPYRYRDFIHAARNGICPQSYFKKGFTCATMAAYLLGFEDYYKMCPDGIYYRLVSGL